MLSLFFREKWISNKSNRFRLLSFESTGSRMESEDKKERIEIEQSVGVEDVDGSGGGDDVYGRRGECRWE